MESTSVSPNLTQWSHLPEDVKNKILDHLCRVPDLKTQKMMSLVNKFLNRAITAPLKEVLRIDFKNSFCIFGDKSKLKKELQEKIDIIENSFKAFIGEPVVGIGAFAIEEDRYTQFLVNNCCHPYSKKLEKLLASENLALSKNWLNLLVANNLIQHSGKSREDSLITIETICDKTLLTKQVLDKIMNLAQNLFPKSSSGEESDEYSQCNEEIEAYIKSGLKCIVKTLLKQGQFELIEGVSDQFQEASSINADVIIEKRYKEYLDEGKFDLAINAAKIIRNPKKRDELLSEICNCVIRNDENDFNFAIEAASEIEDEELHDNCFLEICRYLIDQEDYCMLAPENAFKIKNKTTRNKCLKEICENYADNDDFVPAIETASEIEGDKEIVDTVQIIVDKLAEQEQIEDEIHYLLKTLANSINDNHLERKVLRIIQTLPVKNKKKPRIIT